jgi:hypothetical protein
VVSKSTRWDIRFESHLYQNSNKIRTHSYKEEEEEEEEEEEKLIISSQWGTNIQGACH